MSKEKYWLTWGIAFAIITLFLYLSISYFRPSGDVINPSVSSLSLFLPTFFTLCLNLVELFPAGYFVSLVLGYLAFLVFPLPAVIIPLISSFVNGIFWGWFYGKIKNRNI